MASPATTQTAPTPAATNNSFEQFVERRLERASNQVKIVDLASSLLLIATVVLGVLLAVCVTDAWIFGLGSGARLTILLGLLIFALVVIVRSVGPLLFRRINPAYAAKMIEQSEPKFKNSLLNYVFLRSRPNSQARRVFEAVQEKAAQDLSSIEIENAIDHSRLIQIGFVLVVVTFASGLYKLLSPKDPFATIARVVAPLSDLQAPSRVRVLNVSPGSVELFFGETLPITADIRGGGANTSVQLCYSTDDGQRVNAVIPLSPSENKNEYVGNLTTSDSGIQQSLSYWVVAGDGRSPIYTVKVRPSPTIAVSTIDLRPPTYTELPPLRLIGQADIDALEGTSVHLEATANLAIANATLELLKAPSPPKSIEASPNNQIEKTVSVAPMPSQFDVVERIAMTSVDRTAGADFKLLRVGAEQKFTHYRLKFTTPDGQRNRHEPVYAVRIRPDIAPELEVLEPTENKLRVPVNGKLSIKARAMDPDFRISTIRLVASQKGRVILEQNLTLDQPSGVGNVQGQFRLRPDALQLQPGDEIVFYLIAKDNRRSPISDQPDPNVTRSANFELTIAPPINSDNRTDRGESGDSAQGDESNSDAQESPDGSSQNSKSSSEDSSEQSKSGGEKSSRADGGNAGGSEGSKDSQENQDQSSSGGSGDQNSQSKSQKNQNSGKNGTGDTSSSSSSSAQPADSSSSRDGQPPKPSGEKSQSESRGENAGASEPENAAGDQGESDPSQSGEATGEQNAANSMPGESSAANDAQTEDASSSQDERNSGDQPSTNPKPSTSKSSRGDASRNKQSSAGDPSGQEKQSGDQSESDANKPLDRPLDDQSTEGERFEKLMERLERERNKSSQGTGERSGNQDSQSQPNGQESSNQKSSSGDPTDSENSSQSKTGKSTNDEGQQSQSPQAGQPEMQDTAESAGNSNDRPGEGSQPQGGEPNAQEQGAQSPGANEGTQSSEAQPKPAPDQASKAQSNENSDSEKGAQPNSNDTQSQGSTEPSKSDNESSNQADSSDTSNPRGDSKSKPDAANPQRNQMNESQFPDSSSSNANEFQPTTKLTPEEREHLEQSKKVTDLVVDYLKDQQHRPNADLLNEMNWTDQELREFVRRWEQLKVDASQGNPNAELRYLEALRSLGLPTAVEQARRAQMKRDQLRDLREDGAVSRPPDKFAEAFRDFSKGRAKSGNQ